MERIETLRDWLAEHPPDPGRMTQSAAGVADRALVGDDFFMAVRELLDELSFVDRTEQRARAFEHEPAASGDLRHDAYLAALAEHVAAADGRPAPAWTAAPERFLDRFWFVSDVRGFRATAIAQSPAAFRRRGIFIAAGSLVRV